MNDLPAKALSIRQPWAWAILHAGKDIENRNWSTHFRGPVCIHASAGMTRGEYKDCLRTMHEISIWHWLPPGLTLPAFEDLLRGGIVGTAEITGVVTGSGSPWFFGRYGFELRNVKPVDFIPVKGRLGFFNWRDRIVGQAPTPAQKPLL